MRDGRLALELKGTLPPRNEGPPLHVHHVEIEDGVVIAWTLGAVLNGQRLRLTAGQRGTILGRYRGSDWLGCPERCTDAPTAAA